MPASVRFRSHHSRTWKGRGHNRQKNMQSDGSHSNRLFGREYLLLSVDRFRFAQCQSQCCTGQPIRPALKRSERFVEHVFDEDFVLQRPQVPFSEMRWTSSKTSSPSSSWWPFLSRICVRTSSPFFTICSGLYGRPCTLDDEPDVCSPQRASWKSTDLICLICSLASSYALTLSFSPLLSTEYPGSFRVCLRAT